MAKGDSPMTANTGAPQQPKIDQYSVMHKLMDMQNPSNNPMAPSQGAQMPMPQMGQIGGGQTSMPMTPRMNFDQMNQNNMTQMQPSVAPSDPQEMIRRSMIGNGTFRQ